MSNVAAKSLSLEKNIAMPPCPHCGQRCIICKRPCRGGAITHEDGCPDSLWTPAQTSAVPEHSAE